MESLYNYYLKLPVILVLTFGREELYKWELVEIFAVEKVISLTQDNHGKFIHLTQDDAQARGVRMMMKHLLGF